MPISLPDKGIPLTQNTRIYHIRRTEDARVRYRLRLGPFMTEAQANAVLSIVREGYPAAFTAAAIQEDLESVADIQFETIAAQPAPKSPPMTGAAKPTPPAAPPPPVMAQSAPMRPKVESRPENLAPVAPAAPLKPAPAAAARAPAVPTLTAPPVVQRVMPAKAQPAAKVEPRPENKSPATSPQSLAPAMARPLAQPSPTSSPAPAAAPQKAAPVTPKSVPLRAAPAAAPAALAASAAKTPDTQPRRPPAASPPMLPTVAENLKAEALTLAPDFTPPPVSAAGSATLAHQVSSLLTSMILELEPDDKPRIEKSKITDLPHRQAPSALRLVDEDEDSTDLESTQTMRALTTAELADNKMSQWFAIELSVADRPFDPDAVPDLDIFSAYRLYVIESKGKVGAIHALRLGFFGEQMAAQAVADYLVDHYQKPHVMRVSTAERERFSERRVQARKKVEATGKHAAIEITDQRYIRELST